MRIVNKKDKLKTPFPNLGRGRGSGKLFYANDNEVEGSPGGRAESDLIADLVT